MANYSRPLSLNWQPRKASAGWYENLKIALSLDAR